MSLTSFQNKVRVLTTAEDSPASLMINESCTSMGMIKQNNTGGILPTGTWYCSSKPRDINKDPVLYFVF